MTSQDDILKRLQQQPLINVAIGVVIGLVLVSLLANLEQESVSSRRMQEVNDKSKKIKKMEAMLADL